MLHSIFDEHTDQTVVYYSIVIYKHRQQLKAISRNREHYKSMFISLHHMQYLNSKVFRETCHFYVKTSEPTSHATLKIIIETQ